MLLNKTFLENYRPKTSVRINDSEGQRLFESVEQNEDYDVFISYSSKDLAYAKKFAELLKDNGFGVYIDNNDSLLDKNNVTEETAKRLERVLRCSASLIYLFTDNSAESFWCPWEIGYMTGSGEGKCLIAPVFDDEKAKTMMTHREYLKIYPKVVMGMDNKKMVVAVRERDNNVVRLSDYIYNIDFK